jgi:hypothetical protein
MCYLNWKNILFLTYPPPALIHVSLLYQCFVTYPQHRSLLTVVSATSAPLYQPLHHQWNICHPVMNRFTWQTQPTVNRKHFCMNILCTESCCSQKMHNRTLLFISAHLKYGCHFDYWNQPPNVRMCVCYLDCQEAGLCCYLVIHIENLLHPLQLFTSICDLFTDSLSYKQDRFRV